MPKLIQGRQVCLHGGQCQVPFGACGGLLVGLDQPLRKGANHRIGNVHIGRRIVGRRGSHDGVGRFLHGQLVSQVVGSKSVEVGSNLVYAAAHQFGATIKPTNGKLLHFRGHVAKSVTIPARPYLGLSDADKNEIVERTLDWLQGQIRG